jgi:RNA-directed DNA polymerase
MPWINQGWEEFMTKAKPYEISKRVVWQAYQRVKANRGAAGVDGESLAAFDQDLKNNLYKLWNRMSSGSYFAPPVRLVEMPKGNTGATWPLGIPTVSDRIAQMVVKLVLEPQVEPYFHADSYGYRPGKSALDAVGVTRQRCCRQDWVIDLDIKGFFDSISHRELRVILDQRVRDGVIRRTIDQWLKAGVLENGGVTRSDSGVPQGSGVSPILSNLFLHEVLDTWFEDQVKPRLQGEAALCRFADDAVIICKRQRDAQRVMAVLPKRFETYGLPLHPEKTCVIRFTQPPRAGIF